MASPPVVPKVKGGALPQSVGNARARLAQRVESALGTALHKEPTQIDPRRILVSQHNRNGAPPNMQYIHRTLLKSLLEKGYDYSRPAVGICVEIKSQEEPLVSQQEAHLTPHAAPHRGWCSVRFHRVLALEHLFEVPHEWKGFAGWGPLWSVGLAAEPQGGSRGRSQVVGPP